MKVNLSTGHEQYIRRKIATGKYASADEVVAHAITVFRRVEKMLPSAQDDLRREIDLGLRDIEEGRVSDWDPQSLKRELLAKARKVS